MGHTMASIAKTKRVLTRVDVICLCRDNEQKHQQIADLLREIHGNTVRIHRAVYASNCEEEGVNYDDAA
jgi:hypothetical protein